MQVQEDLKVYINFISFSIAFLSFFLFDIVGKGIPSI